LIQEKAAPAMGRLFFAFFIDGGNGNEVAAGGIEQGSPQDLQCLARVLRRRPWEPPQSRWACCCPPRTAHESPEPAQILPQERAHNFFGNFLSMKEGGLQIISTFALEKRKPLGCAEYIYLLSLFLVNLRRN
jgi:hypothetical protein